MATEKYSEDLKQIRSIMDRSTRFISLSGLSGVLAGIYALLGAIAAFFIINDYQQTGDDYYIFNKLFIPSLATSPLPQLVLVAATVLILAITTAYLLTKRKAKKHQQNLWGSQTLRLVGSFLVPLTIGGLFTLVLLQYQLVGLIAPAMLIFYGLACISASKFTLGTVKYLGLTCAILGLINTQFIGFGLYFWAAGFGVSHIIYGLIMYNKYDRNS